MVTDDIWGDNCALRDKRPHQISYVIIRLEVVCEKVHAPED